MTCPHDDHPDRCAICLLGELVAARQQLALLAHLRQDVADRTRERDAACLALLDIWTIAANASRTDDLLAALQALREIASMARRAREEEMPRG